ncbi:prepilin-type N-terminal cleavage/methylation domain-containing protein [Polaromonas sp.]|uniref:prepilin-type N-terminal cleavage/methylation domain-containing protein n=1 Tax=Polaromonas sp. TaxID=1869339 RepID=UPI0032670618
MRKVHFIARVRQQADKRQIVQTGFTLIELLVVFTLLALLLTLATPRYLKTLESGKAKVQVQNMATLRDAIDKFRADQGRYPAQLEEIVAKQYLRQIPLDPVSGTHGWLTVPPPNTEESGIYDVRPPEPVSATAASAPPADNATGSGQSVTSVDNPGLAPASGTGR